jgi:RNA polymerase sigma factor (TIGR02999 family)
MPETDAGDQRYWEISRLLGGFRNGEPEAEARLLELTYRELKKIAAGNLRRENAARSLQTTDLVHDAYLRLVDQAATHWRDRGHFYQVAAHVMRQILIDNARKRNAGKRGGGVPDIMRARSIWVLSWVRLSAADGRTCSSCRGIRSMTSAIPARSRWS